MAKSRLETTGVSWLALLAAAFTGCGARVAIEDNSGTGGAASTSWSTGTDTGTGYSTGSTVQTSTGTLRTAIGTGSSVGPSYTGASTSTGTVYPGVVTGYATSTRTTAGGTGTGYTTSTGVYTLGDCRGAPLVNAPGQLSVVSDYVTTGSLKGYGFTWMSTISPNSCIAPVYGTTGFWPASSTSALCAAGHVVADTTYQSAEGFGFNLNQSVTSDMLGTVAAPAYVTVSALMFSGGEYVRVQLSGQDGIYYCVEAGRWASGMPIPITNFNSSCWDGTGMALYAGAPISTINLVIPSDATAERPFSLCLTNVTFN